MYRSEFDNKLLKTLDINAIMLHGRSFYLLEHYADLILSKFDSSSVIKLYFDEYDFDFAKKHLSQSNLFGFDNVLFIKSNKALPPSELKSLVDITIKNENSYLIYQQLETDKADNAFKDDYKNKVFTLRVFAPEYHEALTIISQQANHLGLQIDKSSLSHLYALFDGNISLILNELKKLTTYKEQTISKALINSVCFNTNIEDLDSFYFSILNKKPIKDDLLKIYEESQNEFLRDFIRYTQDLILIQSYIKLNGRFDEFDFYGRKMPPHITKQKTTLAQQLDNKKLTKLFNGLLQLILLTRLPKNEGLVIDKKHYILNSIIKLQAIL